MLSRLIITFLPRSKRHLISWLQSPSAVILEQIKKEQLEPDIEKQTNSKLGKEYAKAVYCHHA